MYKRWMVVFWLGFLVTGVSGAQVSTDVGRLEKQRQLFLETDRLLDKQQDIAARNNMVLLHDYLLLPYLQYKLLKHNLNRDDSIETFLVNNQDSRYAGTLRELWLKNLSKRGHWRTFIDQWRGSEKVSMQCLYQLALYQTGKKLQALKAAKQLWLVGKSRPDQCDALFRVLDRSGKISKEMVWQRFGLALKRGNTGLAKYLLRRFNNQEKKTAEFWIKVHRQPGLIENGYWAKFYTHQGEIFAHGVERMARHDPQQAIITWDLFKKVYVIDAQRKNEVEKKLALQLIFNREPVAYQRLAKLGDEDEKVRVWRVRAALREQNWQHVQAALDRLTDNERQQPKWLYWLARSAEQNGDKSLARQYYQQAGLDRSFYGFMAAEANHLNYHFDDRPIVLEQGSLDRLLSRPDFAAANEFRILGRDIDARRQWWYAVSRSSPEEIRVASKLAQLWQWHHIAVFTVAKARYWDDLRLRFPVLYDQEIDHNAALNQLDASLIFGLIRQESVFDQYARSPVGARGLMQIMPKTGRQIARDLRERWRSKNSLYTPDLNIRYGSYYYKKLLKRFDGHFALAAAAYNAGPHRVDRWLPKVEPLPTDIWVETIPYNETRKYVGKVLAYALIYQDRMGRNTLSMQNFLKKIDPVIKE